MEQETEELKKCLQIVPDDDDDVYADATLLASKILIVDYKIHTEKNKPYFKIIRADGNHRWQKKMHFFLSRMSVVYVLTTPILEDGGDDYVCRGIILKDFKHALKHKKEELTLVELGSYLRIEQSLKVQDNDKPKGSNVAGLNQGFWGKAMLTACYLLNKVPNKKNTITPYELWTKRKPNLNYLRVYGYREVVRIPDLKLKTLGERGIECISVGYVVHFKDFRFYVIGPNDSVSINSIIESRDAIFDENRFSSVAIPSLKIPNRTEGIGGLVVPKEVTEEVVQQPELELRKSKRNRTPKDFGPEFQLYLIKGTRDEDDLKIFDKAMKSQDVAFWKESINFEMDSIMGKNTWMLADLPPGCKPLSCKWIFKRKMKMDVKAAFLNSDLDKEAPKQWHQKFDEVVLYNGYLLNQAKNVYIANLMKLEFLSSKFSMKDMGRLMLSLVSGLNMKLVLLWIQVRKLMPNNGQAVSQIIGYTSNPGTQHRQAIQQISNDVENSSTSGWVFLLGGGVISWASKKQTYITGSIMESKFMALAAAGKEVEWLKTLLLEIPLWSKPIAPIFIHCDSAATLAKAYSQMYNEKSIHLAERPTTDKVETAKKPAVRYAEMYRRTSKRSNVSRNQRNWNNLKSQQLGPDFAMKKKACYNCGDFSHLANDCRRRVQRETTRSQNHAYMSPSHRSYGAPMRPSHRPAVHRPHGPPMRPQYRAPWVPTVNRNFPPVNRKLPTCNSNVSTVCCCCSRHVNTARPKAVINRRNRVKDVQASASWVWKSVKPNSASIILKRYDYVDVRGRSRFMMAWVPKKD
nr:hypothetical protein [Tanacetum cinerariifolium]